MSAACVQQRYKQVKDQDMVIAAKLKPWGSECASSRLPLLLGLRITPCQVL